MSTPWTQFGIPEGYAYPELYFNPPTGRLIVSVADKAAQHHRRLFVRSISEPVYRPLTDYPDDITVSSLAVSPSAPVAFFISDRWSLHLGRGGEFWGGDWHAITRCDLASLTLTECAPRDELLFDPPFTSGWLCDVLQIEGGGDTIIVRGCVLQGELRSGRYFIGRLHVATRKISLITQLQDPFM